MPSINLGVPKKMHEDWKRLQAWEQRKVTDALRSHLRRQMARLAASGEADGRKGAIEAQRAIEATDKP